MPEWNVYIGNFNTREIEVYNIFNHYSFYNDCVKAKKKYGKDRALFAEEVRKSLMYYFWSKCEWEVIIGHWPDREGDKEKKIDVYGQVRNNWDHFIEYLFNNQKLLKARK